MTILTDTNYVDKAEDAILNMRGINGKFSLTSTQLRNLAAMTGNLYEETKTRSFEEIRDKVSYLRVKFVYQAGRDKNVKKLLKDAELVNCIEEIDSNESLVRFCRYMEALVAYFTYYSGEDS